MGDTPLVAAEARPNFRLWVRFEDGVEGEVDLSDVAGHGAFRRWVDNPSEFAEVEIAPRLELRPGRATSMSRPIVFMLK